jgi:hypothetical protein
MRRDRDITIVGLHMDLDKLFNVSLDPGLDVARLRQEIVPRVGELVKLLHVYPGKQTADMRVSTLAGSTDVPQQVSCRNPAWSAMP